jgi:cytochrome c-type biogenesis protein CcmH
VFPSPSTMSLQQCPGAIKVAAPRRIACFLGAGWIAILLAIAAVATFASSGRTSLQEVAEALTCQCGCGLTVANCNHPQCEFSVPLRQQIETMISQGTGREQIIGFFRAKYGEKILSAPTSEGFNLLAWIMPFAAVFAGCFIIIGAIFRWRANQVMDERALGNAVTADDPEVRKRLEEEIREQR